MNTILLTLALVVDDRRVLLGFKKRGFGVGRWNGFGGKVNAGEGVAEAAARELEEEAGIRARAIEECGLLYFTFEGSANLLEVHLFRVRHFDGEPRESDEMRPQWFLVDAIPFAQMWGDDEHWMPLFLRGTPFEGRFHFSAQEKLLNFEVTELGNAPAPTA